MADDTLPELGDMIFSMVIGYLGALELMYVVRHLYHWSCGHAVEQNDAESLHRLQENMRNELNEATAREERAGAKAMQDGVLYKDGYRIDPQQAEIDRLKETQRLQAEKEQRRKEIEAELQKQKRIEEETRKQLEAAEAQLAKQRQEAEAAEAAESARKLLEAERAREEEQRRAEEAEAEARRLVAAERAREEEVRRQENEAAAKEVAAREAAAKEAAENERQLFEAERAREEEENAAAQSQMLIEAERERERKQKLIEENARKFLEAEEEMVQMLESRQQLGTSLESAPQTPVIEEPCVRKTFAPLSSHQAAHDDDDDNHNERLTQTVKTQFGQTTNEPYSRTTKSLLFPSVSDEGSSIEPFSSSFSTQPSDEVATGAEEANRIAAYPQLERQEPDGEDNAPGGQYSDDYLRSLDGIKHRPLVREDGSGRRRAFKKRRSSGSSTSSRESRASREEELKMFTSLEEEELKAPQEGDADYTPIKYSSEQSTLKVKGHHRRHKRSPAKDVKSADSSLRGSLEMLGEENTNPWGEVVPEHYKDTAFWKREKAMSIDEEELEFERPAAAPTQESDDETATNMPKAASFEEASHTQNKEAVSNLQKHYSKDEVGDNSTMEAKDESTGSDTKSNLQASQITEGTGDAQRSSASPRLRRSPRIDEMDQYEERWKETAESSTKVQTPSISVQQSPDVGPWRDEYGLVMEGLSDFYDFTASVNPSRSRSTSRNPSPVNTAPNTPLPKNVGYVLTNENADATIEVYDDTGNLEENEFRRENVINFIESLANDNQLSRSRSPSPTVAQVETFNGCATKLKLQNVADTPNRNESDLEEDNAGGAVEMNLLVRAASPLPSMDNIQRSLETRRKKRIKHNDELLERLSIPKEITDESKDASTDEECTTENAEQLVATLRLEQARSRSRSRSPLPTADNLERSLETRRNRLIKHNDEVFEKLHISPEIQAEKEAANEQDCSPENMQLLVESLRVDRSRSRSRSPLPTAANIERSLETRRNRLIQHNDEIFEQLTNSSDTQSPTIEITECNSNFSSMPADECSREEMNLLVESLRSGRSRSRSRARSPLPTSDNIERSLETRRSKLIQHNDEIFEKLQEDLSTNQHNFGLTPTISIEIVGDNQVNDEPCSQEEMSSLVEALRLRRSRSKSPMRRSERARTPEPFSTSSEVEDERELRSRSPSRSQSASPGRFSPPQIVLDCVEDQQTTEADDCSREQMSSLVETLRMRRSRSRTPLGVSERARTSEPLSLATAGNDNVTEERELRSRSPSRSQPGTPEEYIVISEIIDKSNIEQTELTHIAELSDYYDFHMMLNLEASQNRTLAKKSEEYETMLAEKQREVDKDALQKLNSAVEETELRTLTPIQVARADDEPAGEENDKLSDLLDHERLRQLRCSPTTPDYDRTLSSEWHDTQRIKEDTLAGGFKRSTYVGESLDIGSEFEPLRREAAHFQRSQSPSPAFNEAELTEVRQSAAQRREVQDLILAELTAASHNENRHGAKPKTERKSSGDFERTLSKEALDTQRIKEEMLSSGFKRSTYVGESVDMSGKLEEMRRETAEFRRSRSKSRSPMGELECWEVAQIEREAAKRELQDKVLDELQAGTAHFEDFPQYLNADFLDSNRRASDSLLVQKPDLYGPDFDMDPEDYHHFRRFSLNQEQPIEEYPNDDYLCISQIEVRTPSGTRTWIREDYYSDEFQNLPLELDDVSVEAVDVTDEVGEDADDEQAQDREDEESDNSEDDRRTVVDVEDEIDEDICDFNERGPADESHHEISECEEAERDMDPYAGRDASDWHHVDDISELLSPDVAPPGEEGAVGGRPTAASGTPYDSDSFTIDQIYDEAIKNRKQSGILRDFDSILQEMQNNYLDKSETDSTSDSDRYALWAKTRNLEKPKSKRGMEASINLIENERRDHEVRYLGDANVEARQSARLRSRYGYVPVLQNNAAEDIEVDLSYKPRREYNWRKNFKLDEEETRDMNENADGEYDEDAYTNEQYLDLRRYSLGGESITLFSRSPERDKLPDVPEEPHKNEEGVRENFNAEIANETNEKADKPKKKKSKKKLQKKSSLEKANKDEEDSESQVYSRRSSSIQMETDSPKRKSRSRKSSKGSLNNEDSTAALFSPRNSIDCAEAISDIMEEYSEIAPPQKKKTKKRKKVKEVITAEPQMQAETKELPPAALQASEVEPAVDYLETVSATISPETASINMLSTLSPSQSVCVTPASIESEQGLAPAPAVITKSAGATTTTPTTTTVDTFDILKDANFYPLF